MFGHWIPSDVDRRAWRAAPPGGGPGVLVYHAWWGLNDVVREQCERLAVLGYVAIAPDLFGSGEVVTTVDEAQKRIEAFDEAGVGGPLAFGAFQTLLDDEARTGDSIGVIGYSMGAAWALELARQRSEVAAVALYYGTWPQDYGGIRADVLGHFAVGDPWEPESRVREQEQTLRQAGADVEFHRYAEAKHWFAERDRPEYHASSADEAWERTTRFLAARLGAEAA
jgi:carboxymethylenebutenolidase